MSIVEKIAFEETNLDKFLWGIRSLVMLISGIVGEEFAPGTVTSPGHELAELLLTIRRGITESPENMQRVLTSIDDAIELCFLHTDAYSAALKLFKLEKSGELVSNATAAAIINEAIDEAEDRNEISAADEEQGKEEDNKYSEDESEAGQTQEEK